MGPVCLPSGTAFVAEFDTLWIQLILVPRTRILFLLAIASTKRRKGHISCPAPLAKRSIDGAGNH